MDDLKESSGIGPSFEKALNRAGVRTYAQLASMGSRKLAQLAEKIDVPLERIKNDEWVEKAKELTLARR